MLALEAAKSFGGKAAAQRAAGRRDPPGARRLRRDEKPGAAHGGKARRTEGRAGLCRGVPAGRQAAAGRRDAEADRARRDVRSAGPYRPRRFLPRRRRARDCGRPRKDRQPGDARRRAALPRRCWPSRCRSSSTSAPLYNTPPPTQGLASLIILGLYEQLARQSARDLRIRPRPRRSDQARLPRARPRGHRSGEAAAAARTLSRSGVARRRSAEDRPAQGREMAGAARQGRHRLDGRGRRFGSRGVLHPVALLGVRLGLRAAENRRADAEPRFELLARSEGAQPRSRPAACRSTRSIPRSPCSTTAASWPTARWAATASRRPRR